ncbi:MAG: chalcone isomerase family protein [Chromatiales bacterium]
MPPYLPALSDDADAILDADKPRRLQMDMLYSEVAKQKLIDAWNEGFAANHSAEALAPLSERITRFNEMFETLVAGDQVQLDYLPAQGTRVVINGKERGLIPGQDFNKALLKIWLGEAPVTGRLKQDLLGG